MVLQAELYPQVGYHQQGYADTDDYYSKNEYDHKENYYSANENYNSGSSMQMRPNPCITNPQVYKHHPVGHDGYAQQDIWRAKPQGYNQGYRMYMQHSDGNKYGMQHSDSNKYGMHHSDSNHGKYQGYNANNSHGYGKHSNDKHHSSSGAEYESQHWSYMKMEPNRFESLGYDYYCKDPDSSMPNYEQHENQNNWAATDNVWISKGI